MKYAYIREGLVEFTEGRGPLQNYYPPGLLTSFVPVPDDLEQAVCTGWRYREGQFTEPEVMSEIPTIGGVYIPSNKEKTAEYMVGIAAEKEKQKAMAQQARATFRAMIVSDIEAGAETLTANAILDNADLLSTPWQSGAANAVGDIVEYGGRYYKTIQPTGNADPSHTPDLVPAVFVPIDRTHAGTREDPIPAVGNMEYFEGRYYTEAGALYLCTRSTGQSVAHLPSQLVGVYFEKVE